MARSITAELREILADEGWHHQDELVARVGQFIPVELALRKMAWVLRWGTMRREITRPNGWVAEELASRHDYYLAEGRKRKVRDAIYALPNISNEKRDNGMWFRLGG